MAAAKFSFPSHYSRCFQSCVYQLRFLVDSNGRTACNHKGGRGLGPETGPASGSKDLNDRGEFIANYLTFNSSLVRTPNRGVVSCTFAVMACPLQTVEHQVLGDVICPLFTGVAQKIFFVPLPLKYISKRKLAINQKVN